MSLHHLSNSFKDIPNEVFFVQTLHTNARYKYNIFFLPPYNSYYRNFIYT